MKIVEFYPEQQGRPDSKESLDIESRARIVSPGPSTISVKPVSLTIGSVSVDYELENYSVVLVTANHTVVITLPAASTHRGFFYYVKKIDSSNNIVRLEGNSTSELIDGSEYVDLNRPNQYIMVVCDADNWYVIGGEYVGLQSAFEEKLDVQNSLMERLIHEIRKGLIHLSILSDNDVSDEDMED